MATIEVHWGDTTCPQCEEVFDGVSIADDEAFELHNEFECPSCGTIIEREIVIHLTCLRAWTEIPHLTSAVRWGGE